MVAAAILPSSTGTSYLFPFGESLVSKQLMMNSLQMVSTNSKQVLNDAMNKEKPLSLGE
jgi:hypothetical protein